MASLGLLLGGSGVVFELVVVGGAALNILGFVSRPTKDVDVVGLRASGPGQLLARADPLPPELVSAASHVALDLGLAPDWLNPGPSSLLDWGLPDGFDARLIPREYGPRLVVYFAGRIDLIYLKVFAAADSGVGRHTDDLRALGATCDELTAGARWARTHDPSAEFCRSLRNLLRFFACRPPDDLESGCDAPD